MAPARGGAARRRPRPLRPPRARHVLSSATCQSASRCTTRSCTPWLRKAASLLLPPTSSQRLHLPLLLVVAGVAAPQPSGQVEKAFLARAGEAGPPDAATPQVVATLVSEGRSRVGRGTTTVRELGGSFLSVEGARSEDDPQAVINYTNATQLKMFQSVSRSANMVPGLRQKLDDDMLETLRPAKHWCNEYMQHRAELYALSGHHCAAAQGKLNAAEVSERGPGGCTDSDALAGAGGAAAPPLHLATQRCTHAERELACATRLAQLQQALPAPGEAAEGGSMDQRVRTWCHPMYVADTPDVSDNLAVGEPERA